MKKKNRILVLGLTFSMVISSGSLTGCDSAAGSMGKRQLVWNTKEQIMSFLRNQAVIPELTQLTQAL